MNERTIQEEFWAGAFGDSYSARNAGADWLPSNLALFARVLTQTRGVSSVIEFGANIGLNLEALRQLLPQATLAAIEINPQAAQTLRGRLSDVTVFQASILDFEPPQTWDLTFTKGVLIHIHPDRLPDVYDRLFAASNKYILVCEYYNPQPVEVIYRGHAGRLFKRDFAGELLDRFPSLSLRDYGFVYRRDNNYRQDDLTWFLLQKP